MNPSIRGIHHVTAITSDAQRNIDFYCGVLGLRLVKLTVNFDDPGSYHLYYGDEVGHPGTIMTFFAWPGAERGRIGPPQVTTTAFAAPAGAREYWVGRLAEHGVVLDWQGRRLGEAVIGFRDPDGLQLEIIAAEGSSGHAAPSAGPVPPEYAIRGFHGVTLSEKSGEETGWLLTEVMDFRTAGGEGDRTHYVAGGGEGVGGAVDVLRVPAGAAGRMGAGMVHHVAFRTPDDSQQEAWRQGLERLGYGVSPVMDRVYFHSIYYREPGGVLFEIATDPPGFTLDQRPDELGTALMLPPWLERHRAQIERVLPPVHLPAAHGVAVGR